MLVSSSTSNPWSTDSDPNPYSAPPTANLPTQTHPGTPAPFGKPENYLIFSILATFCCCMPLGIPAIVYAAQVDSRWNIGDYYGAQFSSYEARKWCWIAFGVGLATQVFPIVIYALFVFFVLAGTAAAN